MTSTLFYQVIAILLFLFLFNPFNPQVHKSSIQSFLISTKSPFKASRYFFKSLSHISLTKLDSFAISP